MLKKLVALIKNLFRIKVPYHNLKQYRKEYHKKWIDKNKYYERIYRLKNRERINENARKAYHLRKSKKSV